MQILVLGAGAREHAICHAIKNSSLTKKLYAFPGNAGMAEIAKIPKIENNITEIANFASENKIDIVVVGPENYLVDGIIDELQKRNIFAFGPNKFAAQLEGSKDYMKEFCKKNNIPTAEFKSFVSADSAKEYIKDKKEKFVIKTDGLAAGKGVLIPNNIEEANNIIDEMFNGKFGDAGKKIVIEDFLQGSEMSVFGISDGVTVKFFGDAQDHKRIGEGDTGLNTGGMGAYSPTPLINLELKNKIMNKIIGPVISGMHREGTSYEGFIFAGLMVKNNEPTLIEFNIRMGDPEAEVILPRLDTDFVEIMLAAKNNDLKNTDIIFKDLNSLCVVMAAQGYPENYEKGSVIESIPSNDDNTIIYHAGTKRLEGKLLSNGGRVLTITGLGRNLKEAKQNSYKAVEEIKWYNSYYRKDIGWKAL